MSEIQQIKEYHEQKASNPFRSPQAFDTLKLHSSGSKIKRFDPPEIYGKKNNANAQNLQQIQNGKLQINLLGN